MSMSKRMDSEHINRLIKKREQLQLRLRFNEFVKLNIEPFLAVLDSFKVSEITYRVSSFRCVPLEFHELFCDYIQTEALATYQLTEVTICVQDTEVEFALAKYPSVNPFRYVLDASVIGYGSQHSKVLQELTGREPLIEKKAYICWLAYTFLLEVDFQDFAQKVNQQIINTWHGDTLIFPSDYAWLTAYSLEDEWRFSRYE